MVVSFPTIITPEIPFPIALILLGPVCCGVSRSHALHVAPKAVHLCKIVPGSVVEVIMKICIATDQLLLMLSVCSWLCSETQLQPVYLGEDAAWSFCAQVQGHHT